MATAAAAADRATGSPGDRSSRTAVLPGQDPSGSPILAVLVKRTYDVVGATCVRAAEDSKLHPSDIHYDDPMSSAVQFESDFVPYKLATDVVLDGSAHAPGGRPVRQLLASLAVAGVRKDILVTGDRVARFTGGEPAFTDPVPFTAMPLRYERSYGGVDIYSDPKVPCVYPRNPLGRGFAVVNDRRAVEGIPLPNIENPGDPLTPARMFPGHFMYWEHQPMPWGYGWVPRTWEPRASLPGVMPGDRAAEQELRAVYAEMVPPEQRELYDQTGLPDMDFRFFSGASQGLAIPYLQGGETVRAENLSPAGVAEFALPHDRPGISLDIGRGPEEGSVVLQTVMIRMDEGQVDLVWRAAFTYPGPDWLPELTHFELAVL